jgi:quercetin dioxygenase-like cupin family protein
MPTLPTLTTLHRAEFPGEHYATVMVLIDNAGGAPRHTHPGLEMTYILDVSSRCLWTGEPLRP